MENISKMFNFGKKKPNNLEVPKQKKKE